MGVQNKVNQALLAATASLQAKLSQAKSDICNKINEKIADMTITLRGEISYLKTKSDSAFAQIDSQNEILRSLGEMVTTPSDIVVELVAKVEHLCGLVEL